MLLFPPLFRALREMHRYAFDVDPDSQTLLNRRVFAYVDTGIPDGIQIDKNGNVYAGCGDGVQVRDSLFYLPFDPFFFSVYFFILCKLFFFLFYLLSFHNTNPSDVLTENQVWNSQGTLLGKFFIGSVSANMIFAGDGRLVILAETKIFLARIAAQEIRLEFP